MITEPKTKTNNTDTTTTTWLLSTDYYHSWLLDYWLLPLLRSKYSDHLSYTTSPPPPPAGSATTKTSNTTTKNNTDTTPTTDFWLLTTWLLDYRLLDFWQVWSPVSHSQSSSSSSWIRSILNLGDATQWPWGTSSSQRSDFLTPASTKQSVVVQMWVHIETIRLSVKF